MMREQFLNAALNQAWLGRGLCAPNPAVGAVAVQNNHIIAEAFHAGAGTAHAEQLLLQLLPQDCSSIDLYVTLEPCNHWGKTPPCVDAIIQRRFARVIYAYADPNPLVVERNTPALLRAAGIEVIHHPLPSIDAFYESYAHWTRTKMPFVTVKMAQTFDGKIAGEKGARVHLSNEACAAFTHQQRLYTDVILTTAATINSDDPQLNARIDQRVIAKPVAILDRQKILNSKAQIFKTAKKILSYHQDVAEALSDLGALGYHDVWVEAGAKLFNVLHQKRLVHQTYLYLVPSLLGRQATDLYLETDLFENLKTITWQVMDNNVLAALRFF